MIIYSLTENAVTLNVWQKALVIRRLEHVRT